jgi:hypothetical protein
LQIASLEFQNTCMQLIYCISACWSRTKQISSSFHWKLTCSRHDIAKKLLNWHNNNRSLTQFLVQSNFKVFGLTRPGLEPKLFRTRCEHANHYSTDAIPKIYTCICVHGKKKMYKQWCTKHYTTVLYRQCSDLFYWGAF